MTPPPLEGDTPREAAEGSVGRDVHPEVRGGRVRVEGACAGRAVPEVDESDILAPDMP